MIKIHQIVDTLVRGDAISNYCLQIRKYLRSQGYESDIFCGSTALTDSYLKPVVELQSVLPDAQLILHHSTFSPFINRVIAMPNSKILIYHNITPAAYFRDYSRFLFENFREAERENSLFSQGEFSAVVGDSKYNLDIIKKYLPRVKKLFVHPPFLCLERCSYKDRGRSNYRSKGNDFQIVFIGRIAPNKRQFDLVRFFTFYHKYINPRSELQLIGSFSFSDPYFLKLHQYISDNKLKRVVLTGPVSENELRDRLENSDLFLSMSEHEGFCIPVVESISSGVPVFAYRIPPLQELLDDEFLFTQKNFPDIAKRVERLAEDQAYRRMTVRNQSAILARFKTEKLEKSFAEIINKSFVS